PSSLRSWHGLQAGTVTMSGSRGRPPQSTRGKTWSIVVASAAPQYTHGIPPPRRRVLTIAFLQIGHQGSAIGSRPRHMLDHRRPRDVISLLGLIAGIVAAVLLWGDHRGLAWFAMGLTAVHTIAAWKALDEVHKGRSAGLWPFFGMLSIPLSIVLGIHALFA